jgi:hypothetical protein
VSLWWRDPGSKVVAKIKTRFSKIWRAMDSPQEIALRIRKHSSHSRETNRGPLKATEPMPSNQRRYSEGKIITDVG